MGSSIVKCNLEIFEELVLLFKNKAPIPDEKEYPKVTPQQNNYNFPNEIISNEILRESLNDKRIEAIREEIKNIDNPQNTFLKYYIPWDDPKIILPNTLDLVYSQAVLEHVENLEKTYSSINKWLKKGGVMSHSIDFRSHGITKSWNGYRTFSEFQWNIVKGCRVYLINRIPYSSHKELQQNYNFDILIDIPHKMSNDIPINEFSEKFKNLSDEDMTTSCVYMLSIKK